MAQTIKLKRSSTGGAVPSTSSLSLGEVAINTHDGKMYIKKNDGSDAIVEIGAGNGEAVWNSYDYTATSSQTSFSGSDNNSETLSYVPNFLQVFLNGILLDPAVDYAATTGNSVVLTVGATTSDLLQIETFTQIIGTGDILVDTFPVSSTQTAFTLSQDPINKSNISVYVEGVYQESSTYSLSTTTLTLSESPANGTTVEVVIGTRNVTLDGIVDLTISGTLHAGALDLGDANIINVNEISLDTIKGDADANTNITFAGSDVTTFTQGGTERLRLNTTGAQVTGNIVVSGNVDGRDVAADGVTADAALPRTGGAMGGAITTNSTFDGRDVSVDGTKLDGIESSATADQTDVEIRAAVESASDSNVFTNADHSKLDAIEASADVTDATNVTAAGALMRAGGTMTGALDMGSNNITTTGKMLFANVYSATGDLPSASTYHGMFAHVHGTGKGYFAHAGSWVELANQSGLTSTTTIANAALPKAGGTMTGNLQLNNAVELRTLDTGGNARTIVRANSSNELEFGWSANAPVKFMGGGSYTERMRIHTNGNVGIGTDNPPNLLSVRKTITAYEDVISIIGQNSPTDIMGALAYDQATDLMIIRNDQTHATGGIAFRAGGTANHLFIKTGGNVGIGTASPTQKLEVDGDIRIKDARSLFFKRHGDNYAWRIRNESAAAGGTYGFNGSNDLVFEVVSNSNANATPAVGSHSVYPSSANTLVLTETGKVGIGTDAPSAKLNVKAANGAAGIRLTSPSGLGSALNINGSGYGEFYLYQAGGNPKVGLQANGTSYFLGGAITVGHSAGVGISGTPADLNYTEVGPGFLRLNRDDTADAAQISFGKNGATHSYLETRASGLGFVASAGHSFEGGLLAIGLSRAGLGTSNNRKLWVKGSAAFESHTTGTANPSLLNNTAIYLGPSGTRAAGTTVPGTMGYADAGTGLLSGGIAWDHLRNYTSYGNLGYGERPHGWLGSELHSTPGYELSNMIMATREGTAANSETKVAMRWNATGEITTPRNPAFLAYGTSMANQTTEGNHGSWVEGYDRGANFAAGTSAKFTAPVDGIYAFYAHANFNQSITRPFYWRAVKNNTNIGVFYSDTTGGTWVHLSAFITVVMDKNDTFEWRYKGDPDEGAEWAQQGGYLIG